MKDILAFILSFFLKVYRETVGMFSVPNDNDAHAHYDDRNDAMMLILPVCGYSNRLIGFVLWIVIIDYINLN